MIENELKYVLKVKAWEDIVPDKTREIFQAYLSNDARIRKTVTKQGTILEFTYKANLPNFEKEEISKTITNDEFTRLMTVASNKLHKFRYSFNDDGNLWDVDFFVDDNGTIYFCMAECEMPAGIEEPNFLPLIIIENLIYAVPRKNVNDFASKRIADVKYAQEKLKWIDNVYEKTNI